MKQTDFLDQKRLEAALVAGGQYHAISVVDQIDSTNAQLLSAPSPGHMTALLAEHQTQGRGRLEAGPIGATRTWQAPPLRALLLSVLVRPRVGGPQLTLAMALAALEAINETGPPRLVSPLGPRPVTQDRHLSIKWPNDLIIGHKKLGGILAQVGADGRIVVGLGLNVHQSQSELPSQAATSLRLEGYQTNRTELAISILEGFGRHYRTWRARPASLIDQVRPHMSTLGQVVMASLLGGRTLTGTAIDLDQAGRLSLRLDSGRLASLDAGEVTHLRPGSLSRKA
ncbi:MAG: biotin--[acetyl-CoA-carboxylase] ligase [Micrococcales bacterium]|nr:biotin--[acetyl-CoA-carboxylase] ligase [Micrococcales bacterium]